MSAEHDRLAEVPRGRAPWRRWGPYLSERAWGTVREDYSATGEAWDYFPHDHVLRYHRVGRRSIDAGSGPAFRTSMRTSRSSGEAFA